jgi:hypothetical protein
MAEGGFANIQSLNDLEGGISTFGRRMSEARGEIDQTINLYFQDFERALQILEEQLQKALEDLERAEEALERQRNKKVWVEDNDDGDGHWEQADCSAEEARVARCRAAYEQCKQKVDLCRQLISDARSRRNIHEEKFSAMESRISEAITQMGPVRELVEKHRAISAPSGFSSSASSAAPASSSSSASGRMDTYKPRPPMPSGTSYGPRPSAMSDRPPRSPISERMNPAPSRPMTEADRPRSPFGDRVSRSNVPSFRDGISSILNKYKDK